MLEQEEVAGQDRLKPLPEESDNRRMYYQWDSYGDKYSPVGKTVGRLERGMYGFGGYVQGIPTLKKVVLNIDDSIRFENSLQSNILKEIEAFWNLEEKYRELGFLHKRGLLLYGPAGSGKSVCINQICKDLIDRDGIIFYVDASPEVFVELLNTFRQVEPTRKIICLFEDIDSIISTYGESSLLSMLDGESQVDNVLNIATTNYPEILDRRIINRPRRFDSVYLVDYPSESLREQYFLKKVPDLEETTLRKWVALTNNFSFAALSEFLIGVKCFNYPVEVIVKKLRNMENIKIEAVTRKLISK